MIKPSDLPPRPPRPYRPRRHDPAGPRWLRHPGKLILTVGLPGSGKSTWAEQQLAAAIAAGRRDYGRVNRDLVRAMLFGLNGYGVSEQIVTHFSHGGIQRLLYCGNTVLCDDTNLIAQHRATLIEYAGRYNAAVELNSSFLDVPVEECIRRDALRPHPVGADRIRDMWARYEPVAA